ncbi:MAG TPA: hypothetical protein VFL14_08715 [Xanthomonadales bacterium]|nr:hypothetical protein [Xanthomonadales bacterium]
MGKRAYPSLRDWQTLAFEAPFVAASRLTNELASTNPVRLWADWTALGWEKWFAGAEAAAALAGEALIHTATGRVAAFEQLVEASMKPVARRVRGNAAAIRNRRRR